MGSLLMRKLKHNKKPSRRVPFGKLRRLRLRLRQQLVKLNCVQRKMPALLQNVRKKKLGNVSKRNKSDDRQLRPKHNVLRRSGLYKRHGLISGHASSKRKRLAEWRKRKLVGRQRRLAEWPRTRLVDWRRRLVDWRKRLIKLLSKRNASGWRRRSAGQLRKKLVGELWKPTKLLKERFGDGKRRPGWRMKDAEQPKRKLRSERHLRKQLVCWLKQRLGWLMNLVGRSPNVQ
jgi:hypothetical protein